MMSVQYKSPLKPHCYIVKREYAGVYLFKIRKIVKTFYGKFSILQLLKYLYTCIACAPFRKETSKSRKSKNI